MTIVYSHNTALDFWRWHAATGSKLARPRPVRSVEDFGTPPSEDDVLVASRHFRPEGEIAHILVGPARGKRRMTQVCQHYRKDPLPSSSLMRLSEGEYVVSPELLFVQLAGNLDLVSLVRLGYELCGSYVLYAVDQRGFCACEPLTSVSRLKSFAVKARGMRGLANTRSALSRIIDGSASPRETDVSMLLTLPARLGGYGLPHPKLNYRIELSEKRQAELGRFFYKVDAMWVEAKLALEYESDEWHVGKERIHRDSRRRNDLKTLGFDVITATNAEVRSCRDMDNIAKGIARALGVRMRPSVEGYEARKRALRARLIGVNAKSLI